MFSDDPKEIARWKRKWQRLLKRSERILDKRLRNLIRQLVFLAAEGRDDAALERLDRIISLILQHNRRLRNEMIDLTIEEADRAGLTRRPKREIRKEVESGWGKFEKSRAALILGAGKRLIELASGIVLQERMRGGDDREIIARIETRLRANADVAAQTAAMTETHAAAIEAQDMTVRSMGVKVLLKEWAATNDERTRPAHREANGQRVGMDDAFVVGGYDMRFPGDSSLGAPPSLTINCRCGVIYITERRAEVVGVPEGASVNIER